MKTLSSQLSRVIFWIVLFIIGITQIVGLADGNSSKLPFYLSIALFAALTVFLVVQIIERAKPEDSFSTIMRCIISGVVFFIILFEMNLLFDKESLQHLGRTFFSSIFSAASMALIVLWDTVLKSSNDSTSL